MTRRTRLATALLCCLGCSASPTASTPPLALLWEDQFEGAAGTLPDAANWKFDVGTDWGNAQLEYDTDRASNASLDGAGNLVITARRESFEGRAYTSARLTTASRREFRYGRFEARMKLPTGQGLWPAFWLLGSNFSTVGWPATGEIDVMEYRGQEPSAIQGSLHGPGYSGGAALTTKKTVSGTRFDNSFHVFAVEWFPDRIDYFVDGARYQRIEKTTVPGPWVFDHPFNVILNVAVGGNFVGSPGNFTTFPQSMVVDWVRVYAPQS
jgi:beta-glucanase (GH16 family)